MSGEIVSKDSRNNALAKVNEARTKWGLNSVGTNKNTGDVIKAKDDVNDLIAWLAEADTKANSKKPMPDNVSVGDPITNPFTLIETTADSVKNYCACYGNCTGTCSNTCTGGCKNNCFSSCENSTDFKSGY